MESLIKVLSSGIYMYSEVINFSEIVCDVAIKDNRNWNIRNRDATEWKPGNKIVGYDEYPISFNFSANENFIFLSKKIFDCVSDYANKNLTNITGFDSSSIRKYSPDPGFLELESSDIDNPSRKITSLLFLNNVTDGGQITFKNFDISVSPQKGSMIIFPASFAYSFKINKPKNSDSLVVVSHFV